MENPENTYVANFLGCGLVVTGDKLLRLYPNLKSIDANYFIAAKDLPFHLQRRMSLGLVDLLPKEILMLTIATIIILNLMT